LGASAGVQRMAITNVPDSAMEQIETN